MIYVRILLTLILGYFIYLETGWATTLGFLLVCAAMEAIAWWMSQVNRTLDAHNDTLETLVDVCRKLKNHE